MKVTTIKDIARLANVSITTVSRVLNNKPDVSKNTKKRIEEIILNHDFYPNALAKGVSQGKSNTLGLVIPYKDVFLNPFFVEVLKGVNDAANAAGYYILLCTPKNNGESIVSIFKENRVDGIILASPRVDENPICELIKEKVPFISTSKIPNIKGLNYVDTDSKKGTKLAVEYLISLGHIKIGFIGGPGHLASSHDRKKSFCDTINRNELPLKDEWQADGDYLSESGYECMEKLLSLNDPPTAVFASGDIMAFGAIQCLKDKKIEIPKEISIIGFDDVLYSGFIDPPLTTIRQYPHRKGYVAATRLIEILEGSNISRVRELLPVELVIRKSTGPLKCKD